MQSWGSYKEAYPGAGGGNTNPAAWPTLTGATHPTAGEFHGHNRNAGKLAPGNGQAVSAPHEVVGVMSHDKEHESALDGHRDSALASHPDGQFAMNTAATSNHSLSANLEHSLLAMAEPSEAGGRVRSGMFTPILSLKSPTMPVSKSRLYANRSQRLGEQPYLVAPAAESVGARLGSFLVDDWTTPQVGTLALGAYALYSIAART